MSFHWLLFVWFLDSSFPTGQFKFELGLVCRKCSLRKDMLGYDRHWNRYWLLEGSCPEAVTSDDSPASCWVYVERCNQSTTAKRQLKESSDEEEESLPLGQLAQQAQHDTEKTRQAKRRKIQTLAEQEATASWGCYKSSEHVGNLMDYLNSRGVTLTRLRLHACSTCFCFFFFTPCMVKC